MCMHVALQTSCDALERDLHALNALHQAEQRARADAEATSAALAAELEQVGWGVRAGAVYKR